MKSLFSPIHFIITCYLLIGRPYWIKNEFYIFGYIYLWIAIILIGFITFEKLIFPYMKNPTIQKTLSGFFESNYQARFIVSRIYCIVSGGMAFMFLIAMLSMGSVNLFGDDFDSFTALTLCSTGIFTIFLYPLRKKQNDTSREPKN